MVCSSLENTISPPLGNPVKQFKRGLVMPGGGSPNSMFYSMFSNLFSWRVFCPEICFCHILFSQTTCPRSFLPPGSPNSMFYFHIKNLYTKIIKEKKTKPIRQKYQNIAKQNQVTKEIWSRFFC